MNRRRFFTGIFISLACTSIRAAQADVETSALRRLWNWGRKKEIALKVGDVHVVQGNTVIKLPSQASEGDEIVLGIPNSSLRFPAVVRSDSAKILGNHEDLILDTFCNIRLTYQSQSKNWVLA